MPLDPWLQGLHDLMVSNPCQMKTADPVFPRTFFPELEEPARWQLPTWLFAFSVTILFSIVHFAADLLPNVADVLRLGTNAPDWMRQERLVENVWVPVKGIAFRISVLLLALPIASSFCRFLLSLGTRQILKAALVSLVVFVILGALSFPYKDGSGLCSMGRGYGELSSDPFAVESGFYYRRLLLPGIAYVLGFGGIHWYYLFTLGVTFVLIFITSLGLQRWLATASDGSPDATIHAGKDQKWVALTTVSMATSSYIIFQFQYPGYPEQLGHVIVLMMALVPMRSQARWAAVALGLATHDLMIFVLLPVIVFFFRAFRERAVALAIMVLYGILWLAAYRFQPLSLLRGHTDLAPSINSVGIFLEQWPWVIIGALAAFKLLWGVFVWAAVFLLRRRLIRSALALASLALTPLATLVVATDASRLAGLGFLGVLLALTVLWQSIESVWERWLIQAMVVLNILAPSVYVASNFQRIPRAGLYEIAISYLAGLGH